MRLPLGRRAWAWILTGLLGCSAAASSTNTADPEQRPVTETPASSSTPPPSQEPAPGASDAGAPSDAGRDAFALRTPPPLPTYSHGTCPQLTGGPTEATSLTRNFPSGSDTRAFHVVVPPSYDGTKPYPVVFGWHWLNASGGSFIRSGELESATEQMHFIAILPEQLEDSSGKKAYQFDWPFVETWGAPKELTFFDDMLACVAAQYKIDTSRVYGIGVSAGGLWVSYLSTTDRAKYFAAVESLSGGLGQDPTGTWALKYTPQPNKFPTLVLWGGATDWMILDFQQASKNYRDALRKDGHFVVQCTHASGHAMPPINAPDGGTKFASMWQFMLDHPYGLPPGTSPYQQTGLPPVFPSWCSIAP